MSADNLNRQPLKQYYVAVGTSDAKLVCLDCLVNATQNKSASKRVDIATAHACRTHPSSPAAAAAIVVFHMLQHADMTEVEREYTVASFKKQVCRHPDAQSLNDAADAGSPGLRQRDAQPETSRAPESWRPQMSVGGPPCCVLVATDVTLKALTKESLPFGVPLLIQYDLPARKEHYICRLATAFGGAKERRRHRSIVVDFVVASELEQYHLVEKYSLSAIQEMPVLVGDMFAQ